MAGRREVRAVVALAGAGAVALGASLGVVMADTGDDGGPASMTGARGTPATTATGPGATGTGGPGTNAPSGSPGTGTEGRTGTTPGRHQASGPHRVGGVEVVPERPGRTDEALPGLDREPPAATPAPVWEDPPSRPAAARGRLVAGYPGSLLPAAPRARVLSSSVAPGEGRVQVALVATHRHGPDAVLRYYRERLARAGFTESPTSAVGGATAAAFARAGDQVVVTVDPGPARTYSVYAVLGARRG